MRTAKFLIFGIAFGLAGVAGAQTANSPASAPGGGQQPVTGTQTPATPASADAAPRRRVPPTALRMESADKGQPTPPAGNAK